MTELTRDDFIVDFAPEDTIKNVETHCQESKCIVWVDRFSLRGDNSKVCLSDLAIAQVLYPIWEEQSHTEEPDSKFIHLSNLIVMVGAQLREIVNSLDLGVAEEASPQGEGGEEGEGDEEKEGKDADATSNYKSNKSGEEGGEEGEGGA
jgi:hypothetical protein